MTLNSLVSRLQYKFPILQMPIPLPRAVTSKARPYFGVLPKEGGPRVRTERLIQSFGSHYISPNLLYVNSAGGLSVEAIDVYRKLRPSVKVVYNQNGLFFPGWYSGNWRAENQRFASLLTLSDFAIFQSEFCKRSYEELVGPVKSSNLVLYNSVPDPLQGGPLDRKISAGVPIFLISGIFGLDSVHILEPALEAFTRLRKFKLRLAGYFTQDTKDSFIFNNIRQKMDELSKLGLLEQVGKYHGTQLKSVVDGITASIHIRYKDSCPNAVIERMALGIPHIYSNSGGTPELVGDAGLSLNVRETWQEMVQVNIEELVASLEAMVKYSLKLGIEARTRFLQKFTWPQYVATHNFIFSNVLEGQAHD